MQVAHSVCDQVRWCRCLTGREFSDEFLLSYTQSLIVQVSQTAVCNRFHSAEQQLCRWLLLSHDRASSNELVMTQELIADRLGVCREAVSHEATRLQTAGLVSYHRGHIAILDRSGLEERVCECYGVVRSRNRAPHGSVSPRRAASRRGMRMQPAGYVGCPLWVRG